MIFKISYLTKIYEGWPLLLDGFLWLVGNTREERITFPNSMACWFHGWIRQGASSQNFIQMYLCTFAQRVPSALFSHSIMSNSLWFHGLQHARLLCPSPTPGACSNSCPSSRWCHPTISSSVVLFSRIQSFPPSGSFSRSQFFGPGGQFWSFSFSISPSNEYSELISFQIDWFDILAVQGTLKSLLQCHSSEASIFQCSAFFMVQLSHSYMTTGKTIALTVQTFVGKVMLLSLLFNTLSRFVIALLPRSKCLLISWYI